MWSLEREDRTKNNYGVISFKNRVPWKRNKLGSVDHTEFDLLGEYTRLEVEQALYTYLKNGGYKYTYNHMVICILHLPKNHEGSNIFLSKKVYVN